MLLEKRILVKTCLQECRCACSIRIQNMYMDAKILFRHKCSDTNVQTKNRGICTPVHLCTLMQKPLLSGDGGIRTHDLYTASVALSQLSYAPMRFSNDLTIIQENSQNFNTFFYYFSADFLRRFSADSQPGFSAPISTPFTSSCRRRSFAVYFF